MSHSCYSYNEVKNMLIQHKIEQMCGITDEMIYEEMKKLNERENNKKWYEDKKGDLPEKWLSFIILPIICVFICYTLIKTYII